MNFNQKYSIYKKIKYDLPKIIKSNPMVFFGSGGSSNIIVIHNDVALKVIPEYRKTKRMKIESNNDKMEIEFYKFLTNEFIKTNITPHIVGYFSNYKLLDIKKIFPKKCLTDAQLLFVKPEKINYIEDKLCYMKHEYDNYVLKPRADIVILENCPITINSQINMILNMTPRVRISNLINFIHRTIFQFIYTMAQIQSKYKNFIHNDMFLRNILGIVETDFQSNDYVEYIFNKTSYYLPANGFYLKINDFGYSLNPPYLTSTLEIDIKDNPMSKFELHNPKRDIYTFLYDYYDGANFGATSLMNSVDNKLKKIVRHQFRKYININTIDKIQKYNRIKLEWMWNIGNIKILKDSVRFAHEYFDDNTFNQYKKLPKDGNIIKTFSD